MDNVNLNTSLKNSIFSEEIKGLATDYSEIAIDSLLSDDALKEIPIIKSILGIYSISVGIKERFILKKVATFLWRLNNISAKEKKEFLDKISVDERYKDKVFEKLLILLDRMDDNDKAEIIGNLFKAVIQGNIELDDFFRLSSIVDKIYINDIRTFCLYNDNTLDRNMVSELLGTGLFSMHSIEKNLSSLGLMKEVVIAKTNDLQRLGSELRYSFEYKRASLGDTFAKYAKPSYRGYWKQSVGTQ